MLVARAADGSYRTIGLETTSSGGGGEQLCYDVAADSVVYRHDGGATACVLRIGWTGSDALPSSTTSASLVIAGGEELRVRPGDWRRLANTCRG